MPDTPSWSRGAHATRTDGGLTEHDFQIPTRDGAVVTPGVYRTPTNGNADRLVMLGHGGTTDKRADYIVAIARLLAERGIATVAIDGPGHGERATFEFTGDPVEFPRAWNEGGGTEGIVADWSETLDFVEAEFGRRPTGWWGLSMGTMVGIPVIANEPRVEVALLGLMGGWGPNKDDLLQLAPEVTVPLRFLVQWDDEVVPRQRCLDLFGLLGSERKTLHANPGAHSAVPVVEFVASADYLAEYLGRPAT